MRLTRALRRVVALLVLLGVAPAARADCRGFRDEDGDGRGVSRDWQDFPGITCLQLPAGWASVGGDCDDGDASVHPAHAELCDGRDNDCDGTVDDGLPRVWYYVDGDGDGRGRNEGATARYQCPRPAGYAVGNGDCDDADATVYPGAPEICDNKDNDCDHTVDEGLSGVPWYRDADGDGWGDPEAPPLYACALPEGHAPQAGDCDDGDGAVHPGAADPCDGVDQDCDGAFDEDAAWSTRYRDLDGDGWGDADWWVRSCAPVQGYVESPADCDDLLAEVYPGAPDVCDDLDNDCDDALDEDVDWTTAWPDADGDGHGDPTDPLFACSHPGGFVDAGDDCDDEDAAIHPGGVEVCNLLDDDCDGAIDDGTHIAWLDLDGDGWAGPTLGQVPLCAPAIQGQGPPGIDCDDVSPHVHPFAAPGAFIDADCDGQVDVLPEIVPEVPPCEYARLAYADARWTCVEGWWAYVRSLTYECGREAFAHDFLVEDPVVITDLSWSDRSCSARPPVGTLVPPDPPCDDYVLLASVRVPWDGPTGLTCVNGTWHEGWTLPFECDDGAPFYADVLFDTGASCGDVAPCGLGWSVGEDLFVLCRERQIIHVSELLYMCPDGAEEESVIEVPTGEACDVPTVHLTLWPDLDGDGWGRADEGISIDATDGYPVGYAVQPGDCDDGRPEVYPGAVDVCDGEDGDCDGQVDEDADDSDGDGACDARDPCPLDAADDADGDGVCDADD
ncbi:MAG TPA: putative metal-binding motif-containing protein, partial [Myxococcota bacterium]|nr:putative metal-binding motif-containing protein [Myxococcota bacterium]